MSVHHWGCISLCDKKECYDKFYYDENNDGQFLQIDTTNWTTGQIIREFGFPSAKVDKDGSLYE